MIRDKTHFNNTMFSFILRIELVIFAKDKEGNGVKAEVLVKKLNQENTTGELKKKMNIAVKEAKVVRE